MVGDESDVLAESIALGKQLVLSAALVGDREDFDVWWQRSRGWSADMGDSLARIYGDESARTFLQALPFAARWAVGRPALATETGRAEEILALLDTLAAERR